MITERIKLDITPRQAELLLAALRQELKLEGTIIDAGDAVRIRSIISSIKDQGVI